MFLLINKPSGITSHDVVDRVRAVTGERRVGHAGTLDPFAEGLLIIGVGRESTKQLDKFLKLEKQYRAVLKLGATSDTHDLTGVLTTRQSIEPQVPEIEKVLEKFTGPQVQTPPMYSAKKINGKKLYEFARRGIEVERRAVPITIHSLALVSYEWPHLTIDVRCSSGTYIRQLGADIGAALDTGAYLEALTRSAIGSYLLVDAVPLKELTPITWKQFSKVL